MSQTRYPKTPPFTACTHTRLECLSRYMCVDYLSSFDPLTSEVFLQWNVLSLGHLPNFAQNSPSLGNSSFFKQLPFPELLTFTHLYAISTHACAPLHYVSGSFPGVNVGEGSFLSCSLLYSQHFRGGCFHFEF